MRPLEPEPEPDAGRRWRRHRKERLRKDRRRDRRLRRADRHPFQANQGWPAQSKGIWDRARQIASGEDGSPAGCAIRIGSRNNSGSPGRGTAIEERDASRDQRQVGRQPFEHLHRPHIDRPGSGWCRCSPGPPSSLVPDNALRELVTVVMRAEANGRHDQAYSTRSCPCSSRIKRTINAFTFLSVMGRNGLHRVRSRELSKGPTKSLRKRDFPTPPARIGRVQSQRDGKKDFAPPSRRDTNSRFLSAAG